MAIHIGSMDQRTPEQRWWDEFLAEADALEAEQTALKHATELDRAGRYVEADDHLRQAGVGAEAVRTRRLHIAWRLAQGEAIS